MKKAVFIVAPETFRDEEYYVPRQILEDANVEVITASVKVGGLVGRFGYKTTSSLLISDINYNYFDAIVYIGGGGASVFFDNADALKLAVDFFNSKKITAAICIAGVILANAGILQNKKATVFIDGKDTLIKSGAHYTGNTLEVDGNIITANGPEAAESFGKAILNQLNIINMCEVEQ
ncbi:MAG: DJ-1/PfpI family protein [Endomicrobium sp.]|nr:DJ-1/PfpI family protein [Endomicrobium sp.]